MDSDFVAPYSLNPNPAAEPAVQIADLEYRLTRWLVADPSVLCALSQACRGDKRLEHITKTLGRMVALHKSFDLDTTRGGTQ